MSNADGIVQERWTLGTDTAAAQKVESRAVDSATGEPLVFATFTARFGSPPPAEPLAITSLVAASGRAYQVASGFSSGAVQYTDRAYKVTSAPSAVQGLTYIRTANADKAASPGSASFLSFDVNQNVVVYVAHDDRLARPAWLSGWTDTGEHVTAEGSEGFSLLRKPFDAGTVTLGSKATTATSTASMYTVIIAPVR